VKDHEIEHLLRDDREALSREANIPSAGLVYWRASIRARSESARKVEQPFAIVHGLAAAALGGVGLALGGFLWQSLSLFELPRLEPLTTAALCAAALVVISPLALVALGSRTRFDRPQD
jgi:hypothetical protein